MTSVKYRERKISDNQFIRDVLHEYDSAKVPRGLHFDKNSTKE